MFDLRYHALSLTGVFPALGIGIVLRASLGDSLVSSANREVRGSLRAATSIEHADTERFFCSAACAEKVVRSPDRYLRDTDPVRR